MRIKLEILVYCLMEFFFGTLVILWDYHAPVSLILSLSLSRRRATLKSLVYLELINKYRRRAWSLRKWRDDMDELPKAEQTHMHIHTLNLAEFQTLIEVDRYERALASALPQSSLRIQKTLSIQDNFNNEFFILLVLMLGQFVWRFVKFSIKLKVSHSSHN